jgi:alpha-mannosidase
VISAFSRSRNNKYYVVRFYETVGRKSEVTIKVPKVTIAYLTNIREDIIKKLPVEDGRITYTIAPHEIATILFK